MRDGSIRISIESFIKPDLSLEQPDYIPKARFGASLSECQLETEENDFFLRISNFPLPDGLRLSKVKIRGHISVDEVGFNLSNGVLTGYLTEDALIEAVNVLRELCSADEKPEICDRVPPSFFAEGEEGKEVRELFFTILGGADVKYNAGQVSEACDDDCNAVSVCILVEGQATPSEGLNTCKDGLLNGGETDVDCGGYCSPCNVLQRCREDNDCQSNICIGQVCVAE